MLKSIKSLDHIRAQLAELYTTEKTYLSNLERFHTMNWSIAKMDQPGEKTVDKNHPFLQYLSALGPILNLHKRIMRELESEEMVALRKKLNETDPTSEEYPKLVSDYTQKNTEIMLELSPYFKVYVDYVRDYEAIIEASNSFKQEYPKRFELLINHLGVPSLDTILITPIQRVPRYTLFYKEVEKFKNEIIATNENEIIEKVKGWNTKVALDSIKRSAGTINESQRKHEGLGAFVFARKMIVNRGTHNVSAFLQETAKVNEATLGHLDVNAKEIIGLYGRIFKNKKNLFLIPEKTAEKLKAEMKKKIAYNLVGMMKLDARAKKINRPVKFENIVTILLKYKPEDLDFILNEAQDILDAQSGLKKRQGQDNRAVKDIRLLVRRALGSKKIVAAMEHAEALYPDGSSVRNLIELRNQLPKRRLTTMKSTWRNSPRHMIKQVLLDVVATDNLDVIPESMQEHHDMLVESVTTCMSQCVPRKLTNEEKENPHKVNLNKIHAKEGLKRYKSIIKLLSDDREKDFMEELEKLVAKMPDQSRSEYVVQFATSYKSKNKAIKELTTYLATIPSDKTSNEEYTNFAMNFKSFYHSCKVIDNQNKLRLVNRNTNDLADAMIVVMRHPSTKGFANRLKAVVGCEKDKTQVAVDSSCDLDELNNLKTHYDVMNVRPQDADLCAAIKTIEAFVAADDFSLDTKKVKQFKSAFNVSSERVNLLKARKDEQAAAKKRSKAEADRAAERAQAAADIAKNAPPKKLSELMSQQMKTAQQKAKPKTPPAIGDNEPAQRRRDQ